MAGNRAAANRMATKYYEPLGEDYLTTAAEKVGLPGLVFSLPMKRGEDSDTKLRGIAMMGWHGVVSGGRLMCTAPYDGSTNAGLVRLSGMVSKLMRISAFKDFKIHGVRQGADLRPLTELPNPSTGISMGADGVRQLFAHAEETTRAAAAAAEMEAAAEAAEAAEEEFAANGEGAAENEGAAEPARRRAGAGRAGAGRAGAGRAGSMLASADCKPPMPKAAPELAAASAAPYRGVKGA